MRSTMLALFGLTLSFAACGEDDACGEGLELKDGACVAGSGGQSGSGGSGSSGKGGRSAGGAGGASAGSSGSNAGENGASGETGGSADFGDACADDSACGGDTDYCAAQPGAPAYCTASGCDADASICPTDWTCFNVGQFAPGEPWVCIQP